MPIKSWGFLLSLSLMGCAQSGQEPLPSSLPVNDRGRVTVTQDLHPAGPTTRREWRREHETSPYKIELERARAGSRLVGSARLLRRPDGAWVIDLAGHSPEVLPKAGETQATKVQLSVENGPAWRVFVLREYLPVIQAGISTESEPSLDLTFERSQ